MIFFCQRMEQNKEIEYVGYEQGDIHGQAQRLQLKTG